MSPTSSRGYTSKVKTRSGYPALRRDQMALGPLAGVDAPTYLLPSSYPSLPRAWHASPPTYSAAQSLYLQLGHPAPTGSQQFNWSGILTSNAPVPQPPSRPGTSPSA
jgi:hypothetical protein